MDESLIIEIWDTFKLFIPEKNKTIAAENYINFVLSQGIDEKELNSFTGYDANLDDAIQGVVADASQYDDSDDEDYYDEDNFDSYESD